MRPQELHQSPLSAQHATQPSPQQWAEQSTQPPRRHGRPARMIRWATLGAAALAVVAVAGCTSSHPSGPHTPSAGPTGTAAVTTKAKPGTGLPSGVTAATSLPTKIANEVSLRKNVAVNSCSKIDGGWAASGTVSNPATATKTYTITVFFTTTSATVIDLAETHVDVAAGGHAKWTASKKFHASPSMLCVLRGVS